MNPFARKYSFFGDFEWRNKIFNELLSVLMPDCIYRITNSATEKYIELKDGTLFRFIPLLDSCRGTIIYDAYVQPNIDMKYVDRIVAPMIRGGDVYFMEHIEDAYLYSRNRVYK